MLIPKLRYTYYFLLLVLFIATNSPLFAVDYSNTENWAALPQKEDNADWVPNASGLKNNQDNALADVFYIHPTTDIMGFKGNANINNERLNKYTDDFPIKNQASVYNGSCRVFAPRYRQAALNNFFARNSDHAQNAFDTAYADIKAAFEYYLKYYNNGRPIIIAGHSQGSLHAKRLLQEFFDGKPLSSQLVEAYIIGYPTHENEFSFLKPSQNPEDIGGYISYCTFGENAKADWMSEYKNAVCVNPLSWKQDEVFVPAKEQIGALKKGESELVKHAFGCKCKNGILEIQKPDVKGFPTIGFKNYHLVDYNLFYLNIRENVALRIDTFLKKQKTK